MIVQEHSIDMKNVELSERREIQNVDGIVVIRHTRKMRIESIQGWFPRRYKSVGKMNMEYTVIKRREKGNMSTSISTEMSPEELREFQECWKEIWELSYMCHHSQSFLPPEDQLVKEGLATEEPGMHTDVEVLGRGRVGKEEYYNQHSEEELFGAN